MKKTLVSLLLMITVTIGYTQQVKQPEPISVEMYRKKAKGQRVAALVLGGAGLISMYYGLSNLQFFANEQDDKVTVPVIVGLTLIGSTIPLIIIADNNSKKSKKLSTSFMLQRTPPLIAALKSTTYYPSVSISFDF